MDEDEKEYIIPDQEDGSLVDRFFGGGNWLDKTVRTVGRMIPGGIGTAIGAIQDANKAGVVKNPALDLIGNGIKSKIDGVQRAITEDNYTEGQKERIKDLIMLNEAQQHHVDSGKTVRPKNVANFNYMGDKALMGNGGMSQYVYNYPAALLNDPKAVGLNILGQFGYKADDDGNIIVDDTFDFSKPKEGTTNAGWVREKLMPWMFPENEDQSSNPTAPRSVINLGKIEDWGRNAEDYDGDTTWGNNNYVRPKAFVELGQKEY